jgi:hypothetical protein
VTAGATQNGRLGSLTAAAGVMYFQWQRDSVAGLVLTRAHRLGGGARADGTNVGHNLTVTVTAALRAARLTRRDHRDVAVAP